MIAISLATIKMVLEIMVLKTTIVMIDNGGDSDGKDDD